MQNTTNSSKKTTNTNSKKAATQQQQQAQANVTISAAQLQQLQAQAAQLQQLQAAANNANLQKTNIMQTIASVQAQANTATATTVAATQQQANTASASANNSTTFVSKMHAICAQHLNNLCASNSVLMQQLCACIVANSKQKNTAQQALNTRAKAYIKHYAQTNNIALAVNTRTNNTQKQQAQANTAQAQSSSIVVVSAYNKRA